jgi:hypothetical protein
VSRRDLVLPVAELRVVLLQADALPLQRVGELVYVVLRRRRADRREAKAGVDRHELPVDDDCKRELVLECDLELRAALGELRLHPLQERPLAHRGRLSVELDVVDDHRAGAGRVRKHPKGLGIGHEPDLADRAHPVDRLELIERVHGLHRHRQADAAPDAALQPAQGARLRADGAVVAAPEEADETEARLVR